MRPSAPAQRATPQRPTPPLLEDEEVVDEGVGVARLEAPTPESHPRVQIKRDAAEAYVPPRNILRDAEGEEATQARHLQYTAGKALQGSLPSRRVLTPEDFERCPRTGLSRASTHMEAANLVTAYEQTVKQEANFQKTFNNNVRTLIARHEVTVGLMHLWDFASAFVESPGSKALTAQLFLIVQHCRDEGFVREGLLNLAAPEGRWMLDLINILQSIVVQERSLGIAERVAAINYSVITLSKHYARKVFNTPFVPLDKEAKISTFYMRAVVKLLVLCDDLGVYRNERMERLVSASRRREMSDLELMGNLRRVLTTPDDGEPVDVGAVLDQSYGALREPERGSGYPGEEDDYDENIEIDGY